MPDFLFDHITRINKKIQKTDALFLFLDFDGTLVPFRDRPSQVKTPETVKKVLRQLLKCPAVKVIIITGRALADIKTLLNLRGVSFIALHGLEMESSDGSQFRWAQAERARSTLETIKERMRRELKREKGAFLEDKELSMVLHYRLLPAHRVSLVRKKFMTIVHDTDTERLLEIISGAKVMEARPQGWNKGKALEAFLAKYNKGNSTLVVYIGDDATDEDAFRSLGKRGVTIHVRNTSRRTTRARYWVKDPTEVYRFLRLLSTLVHDE
jgi:trehalose 6-phosphate phosphatase